MADWAPPLEAVDEVWDSAWNTYEIAAAYCDPARGFEAKIGEWEVKYAPRLVRSPKTGKPVRASNAGPFQWWFTARSAIFEKAIEAYERAIQNHDMSHPGDARFSQHILNAKRRVVHQHLTLKKEHDYSPNKIDLAVCGVLGYQARLDCIAAGIGAKPERRPPIRVR